MKRNPRGLSASVYAGMHDSGEREKFKTGAVRDSADGKPRIDLISPFTIIREAKWMQEGCNKYGDRNWQRGMPFSRVYASLLRHVFAVGLGDKSEDHLAAIRCNAGFIIHFEEMIKRKLLPKELDDMPDYLPKRRPRRNTDRISDIDYKDWKRTVMKYVRTKRTRPFHKSDN